MTKQKQKEMIEKYVYKISEMNKLALDSFTQELFTLKHEMDQTVFKFILKAVDIQIENLNNGMRFSPIAVMGEIKLSEL